MNSLGHGSGQFAQIVLTLGRFYTGKVGLRASVSLERCQKALVLQVINTNRIRERVEPIFFGLAAVFSVYVTVPQAVGRSRHSQHTHIGVVLTQPVDEYGVLALFARRRQAVALVYNKELLFRKFAQAACQSLRGANYHLPVDVYL